ncbi:MAG: hypothetical protein JWM85_2676, partial [Acidimicrobiaceae bacterium]|nr:hypothetical protein [Acidimicrobiaceae bacterium]
MTQQVSTRPELDGLDVEYPVTQEQIDNLHHAGWASLPGLLQTSTVEKLRELIVSQPVRPLDALGKSFRKVGGAAPDTGVQFLDHESDPRHNYNHEGMAWRIPFFQEVAASTRLGSAA